MKSNNNDVSFAIYKLVAFLSSKKLIQESDKRFAINYLFGELGLPGKSLDPSEEGAIIVNEVMNNFKLEDTLARLANYAIDNKLINSFEADHLIDKLLGSLMPKPSQVISSFKKTELMNPEDAFNDFFELSKNSYYIKYDRIAKNKEWSQKTPFGRVDLTINLSKPEKTPEEIIAAKKAKPNTYPLCVLCFENIGFFGNTSKASRQNLRYIPVTLNDTKMFVQYSPYGYFNHHLIVNSFDHKPMKISKSTFVTLIEFIQKYPFYSIGSNADIPIVGGSILSHLHFQGGAGEFPITEAEVIETIATDNIKIDLLKWPLSTMRVVGKNVVDVVNMADKILTEWKGYDNPKLDILSSSADGSQQNSITPFAKKVGDDFHLYLILRNNGTSEKYPNGIFHVHEKVWNIKKENIGIIEAIGKAILPARLLKQVPEMVDAFKNNVKTLGGDLVTHQRWFDEAKGSFEKGEFYDHLIEKIGNTFVEGLSHCGVFKDNEFEHFHKFALKFK